MSWLRLDDNFTANRKIAELSDGEFRAWMRLLCHCAKVKDGAFSGRLACREIVGVTARKLSLFSDCGLLDFTGGDSYEVHDWAVYNPTDMGSAERMRRFRENNPRVSAAKWDETRELIFTRDKGVCIDCGAKHESWHADHEPIRKVLAEQGESIYDLRFIFTRCPACHARKTKPHKRTQTEPRPNLNGSSRGRIPSPPQKEKALIDNRKARKGEPELITTGARAFLEHLKRKAN